MPARKELLAEFQRGYDAGFVTGFERAQIGLGGRRAPTRQPGDVERFLKPKRKRKLSAWNKFVKQNSKKPRFRYARSNKINLKKMAIAFRKTPAGKKKRR